ncbi:MAG TPA: NUDIX domain-containing protein [Spirochaetales bacterium]|nr:NUDIX domain-containing protein [Spirochaetales bacterium]HRY55609.1 NUDIX domain-containing protein [Spirochaetia bacterium]HRZ65790.1 NUDIX domain-containing protein [Spirochaetia bacterium]
MSQQGQGRSVAAILTRRGRVFAARRGPGGAMGGKWEFPGGKVEPGEGDRAAVERELLEEFGARAKAGALVGEVDFLHRGRIRILAAYAAELEEGSPLVPTEHVELRWASLEELAKLDLADSDRRLLPHIARLAPARGDPD